MNKRFALFLTLIFSIFLVTGCGSEPEPITLTEIAAAVRETVAAETDRVDDAPVATAPAVVSVDGTPAPAPTAAAGPETVEIVVTQIVTETLPVPALGSVERPLRVVFAPTLDQRVTEFRGGMLIGALAEELGFAVEPILPESFAATVDAICAAPDRTVGFMPAFIYVLARDRCNAQAELLATRFDYGVQAAMLVVRRDSPIDELADLNGLRWAVDDLNSVGNGLYFQALFQTEGIQPGQILETRTESSSMIALENGEVDFVTASFTPPLLPRLERQWVFGQDDPETWRQLGIPASRHPIGFIIVLARAEDGGFQIRDARAAVFDVAPTIFEDTRILDLTTPLPNEAVVLGAEIPLGTARAISEFLLTYGASEACQASVCSGDFYNWTGFEAATTGSFAPLLLIRDTLALTDEQILALFDE